MSAVLYKGAVAPETFTFRVRGLDLPTVTSAIITVKKTGGTPADWSGDQVVQDRRGVTVRHVMQSGEADVLGDYTAVAKLTVSTGTIRSEPADFTIEDPQP